MGIFTNRFRFLVVIGAFLCLTSINSNYITINFTFICMQNDYSDPLLSENGTLVSRYVYTPTEKSLIIWAVAAGTIIGTFPINYAYIRFGARIPFLIAGYLSSLATLCIPFAAKLSLPFLLLLRFIQGLAYSADFAAIGILTVRWAPLTETGIFIAIMTSFTPISSTITNPLTGALCTSDFGWKSSFYVHSVACALFFMGWLWYYRDDPHKHPKISEKELELIQKDKTKAHIDGDSFVPYWEILKNKTILIVWFNSLTEMTTVTLLLSYCAIYFHNVLGFDISTTGILASVAALLHMPLKIIFGIFSDKVRSVSECTKMLICNSIAVGGAGVCCLLTGVVGHLWSGWAGVICFTGVYLCMGVNCGGFYKCGTLVSRQYAHFVLATIQFMKCVALVAAPASVALFVSDESSVSQWAPVFYLNGGFLIVSHLMFCWICTDQPAQFTQITRENRNTMPIHPQLHISTGKMCSH